jgi:hypothetical protein
MKTPILVCAVALWLPGCKTDSAGQETAVAGPAGAAAASASPGKPQAPVAIDGQLSGATVELRLRFESAATDVQVRVNGVDGLGVSGNPVLVSGKSFAAGETASFTVPIVPGPGQGMLAVQVSATYPGGQRSAVRAFAIGTPSADQLRRAQDGTTTIGGEPVKLMPLDPPKQ